MESVRHSTIHSLRWPKITPDSATNRVPGFLSSRSNGSSPPPHSQDSVVPLPLGHLLAGEGVGGGVGRIKRQKLRHSMYTIMPRWRHISFNRSYGTYRTMKATKSLYINSTHWEKVRILLSSCWLMYPTRLLPSYGSVVIVGPLGRSSKWWSLSSAMSSTSKTWWSWLWSPWWRSSSSQQISIQRKRRTIRRRQQTGVI